MDERQLVEIEKRSRRLKNPHRQDVLDLLLEVRTLKADNQGEQLSPKQKAAIQEIREQREQKKKGLRRELIRIAEAVGGL
ncbi:MAG: hypothetical protein M3209_00420 [Acidobacteriota bacterium]|nr:hypothetical protein [Acidobacteriota bacterium]